MKTANDVITSVNDASCARLLAFVFASVLAAACTTDSEPLVAESLDGRLRAFVVDREDGTHETGWVLELASGQHVPLEPSEQLEPHNGALVTIGARAAAERLSVDSLVLRAPAAEAEHATVIDGAPRTVRVAMVLLNFQGVTPQRFTPADGRARLTTVHDYYQELSYGIWNVEGEVFGPLQIARPPDCDLGRIGDLARAAAAAAGISLAGFDHVAVTLPANDDSGLDCACGVAWLGNSPAQRTPRLGDTSYYTCTDPNAFAHELGHGFGLHHAATANCNGVSYRRNVYDACAIAEYGNQFNTMGNGLGHMNAFQKTTMKWMDRCNTVKVSRDATFEIDAIQVPSNRVQGLQIATGDTRQGQPLFYYVEYRNPALARFNAGGNTPRERGPGVHLDVARSPTTSSGDARPVLLDVSPGRPGGFTDPRLTAGRRFDDPDGRVGIAVVETTRDKARVQVTFPGGGTGANTCVDGSTPPGPGDPPAPAATLYQHCSFGGWAVSLPPGDYAASDLIARGGRDNDASALRVSAGYEVTLYDGPDFTGTQLVLTAETPCFVARSFNDRLSSLRVRAVGAAR